MESPPFLYQTPYEPDESTNPGVGVINIGVAVSSAGWNGVFVASITGCPPD